jgi:hypothetical protein
MLVRKRVEEKCGAKVQYVAACPLWRGYWSEFWVKMGASPNVGDGYDAANMPILCARRFDLVQAMNRIRIIFKRCKPFDIDKVGGYNHTRLEHAV